MSDDHLRSRFDLASEDVDGEDRQVQRYSRIISHKTLVD